VLVYLHVSFQEACRRRHMLQANVDWWGRQLGRLETARQAANLIVDTDSLTLAQVIEHILAALRLDPNP
jgi:hypothetical protein